MDLIRFDKDAFTIAPAVTICVTREAYRVLLDLNINPEFYVYQLSQLKRFIVIPDEEKNKFWLQTSFGRFLCGTDDKSKDHLSIFHFVENNLYKQNEAIKDGIIFSLQSDFTVMVNLPGEGKNYSYCNGEKKDTASVDVSSGEAALKDILEKLSLIRKETAAAVISESEDEESPYHAILEQAQQFSILTGELEEKKSAERAEISNRNKDIQLTVNMKLMNGETKASHLEDILGKNKTAGFTDKDLTAYHQKLIEEQKKRQFPMNRSQMEAIQKGICTKDIFLLQCPPGSSKTTVVLEWLKYFIKQEHKRVLYFSQNSKAVDRVLRGVAMDKTIDYIRIGSTNGNRREEIQSCLFENRVADLNKNVSQAAKETLAEVQNLIQHWKQFIEKLQGLPELTEKIDHREEQLKEEIDEQLLSVKKQQKTTLTQVQTVKREYESTYPKYIKCVEEINDFGSKSGISNKLAMKNYGENLQLKDKLEISLLENHKKLKELTSQYQALQKKFDSSKAELKTTFVEEMMEYMKAYITFVGKLFADIPKDPHRAGLFDQVQIRMDDLYAGEKMDEMVAAITEEIKRAETLLNLETNWENTISKQREEILNKIIFDNVDLVGAVDIGFSSLKAISNLEFDITILDDAELSQIQDALIPLSMSNKWLLLGDYKQIRPSVDQELVDLCDMNGIETELLKKSLFEKLAEQLPAENKGMLDTQYRMPGEIADILSEWFYDNRFHSSEVTRGIPGMLPQLSKKPLIFIDTSHLSSRQESKFEKDGYYNSLEAEICKRLVALLAKEGDCDFDNVGILSSFPAQVSCIQNALRTVIEEDLAESMVGTPSLIKGQALDLVIYSFCRSSKKKATTSRLGILNDLRSLNTVLCSCNKTMVLIGDVDFLSGCLYMETDEEGKEIYENSEKQFSAFIQKLVSDCKNGRGDLLDAKLFKERG